MTHSLSVSGLARFRNIHAGKSVAIIGNGPSLNGHDLTSLSRTMTTNRALALIPQPTYHCCLERTHALREPEVYTRLAKAGKLFVAGDWEQGHVIPLLNGGPVKFSRDLEEGVVTQIGTVGSVIWAALQIASYCGYNPLYLIGVDLAGPHFDGSPASKRLADQNSLFKFVPADVEVYVVGEDSKAAFPKRSFMEACQ